MINPEPGKFYKTHSGKKVHILGRREDDEEEYPFVGYLVGGVVETWTEDGRYDRLRFDAPLDLIEEWVEPRSGVMWANFYNNESEGESGVWLVWHRTRAAADKDITRGRIARVKVEWKEGQWDD